MRTLDLSTVMVKLNKLNVLKEKKVEEILFHAKPKRMISEEIRNQLSLDLLSDLREIQDEIEELMGIEVEVEDKLAKNIIKG